MTARCSLPGAWLGMVLVVALGACSPSQDSVDGDAESESGGDATPAASSDTYFEVTGATEVTVDPAQATLSQNRAGIWTLNLVSAPSSIRELGRSYSANLFFSADFDAEPGTYPIQFSYQGQPNTLGGSFVGDGLYSHDTSGEARFTEFGEEISVEFEFTTYATSGGSSERPAVTVRGAAVVPRGEFGG